jgi:hypothetical protein
MSNSFKNNNENKTRLNSQEKKEEYNVEVDELHKKFQIIKDERKKAQLQEEIIKKRLHNLSNQEKINLSRIDSTKKIIETQRENKDFMKRQEKIKKENYKRKEKDSIEKKQRVKSKNEKIKEGVSQNKTLKEIRAMNINLSIKEEQKQNKKIQILNKLEDILKNATLHQSVRAMEYLIDEKRKRELLEKKIKYKDELIEKMNSEEITKNQLENELQQLNKEEYDKNQKIEINNEFSLNRKINDIKIKKN